MVKRVGETVETWSRPPGKIPDTSSCRRFDGKKLDVAAALTFPRPDFAPRHQPGMIIRFKAQPAGIPTTGFAPDELLAVANGAGIVAEDMPRCAAFGFFLVIHWLYFRECLQTL